MNHKNARPLLLPFILVAAACFCISINATTFTIGVTGTAPNYSYNPKVISIQQGDTIIWNQLSTIHSVTGDTVGEPLCGTRFPGSCTNTFTSPGTFLYHCINHVSFGMTGVVNVAVSPPPPTVSITNPAGGAVFAAPASVLISAAASSTMSIVTNVQFLTNGAAIGSSKTAPFSLQTSPLAAGSYSLKAIATDGNGLSTTSSAVSISVVTPVVLTNFFPRVINSHFVFDHTANPGLRYVVQNSTNFVNWSAIATNTATSNSIEVMDTFQVGNMIFYRVGRMPNP